jgi:hypothetical protein
LRNEAEFFLLRNGEVGLVPDQVAVGSQVA